MTARDTIGQTDGTAIRSVRTAVEVNKKGDTNEPPQIVQTAQKRRT